MQAYDQTDQQLHQIAQIIARVNQAFVPHEADHSHANLYYDVLSDRIMGRWISANSQQMILSLRLAGAQLEWLDLAGNSLWQAGVVGKSFEGLEQAVQENLPLLGLAADNYPDQMPFEIPNYAFKSEPIQPFDPEALNQWRHYRQLAQFAAQMLMRHLQAASDIRIWPHHFDTGIFIEPQGRPGLGFGLAMQDKMVGTPYFYLSAYPKEGEIDYSKKPKLIYGHWELNENWKGAVLSLFELHDQQSNRQLEMIQTWLWQLSRFFN